MLTQATLGRGGYLVQTDSSVMLTQEAPSFLVAEHVSGYCMYSSSTILVFTMGDGVNGFTLDPMIGEFVLTHPDLQIPKRGKVRPWCAIVAAITLVRQISMILRLRARPRNSALLWCDSFPARTFQRKSLDWKPEQLT